MRLVRVTKEAGMTLFALQGADGQAEMEIRVVDEILEGSMEIEGVDSASPAAVAHGIHFAQQLAGAGGLMSPIGSSVWRRLPAPPDGIAEVDVVFAIPADAPIGTEPGTYVTLTWTGDGYTSASDERVYPPDAIWVVDFEFDDEDGDGGLFREG